MGLVLGYKTEAEQDDNVGIWKEHKHLILAGSDKNWTSGGYNGDQLGTR